MQPESQVGVILPLTACLYQEAGSATIVYHLDFLQRTITEETDAPEPEECHAV